MKRSKLLLISAVLGTAYVLYLIYYFGGVIVNSSGTSEEVGGALAAMLVAPHMVLTAIAVIFNWLGFALKVKWAALVAGILYAVAMVLFIVYFMFVIIEMILCFVAYGKMKKAEQKG